MDVDRSRERDRGDRDRDERRRDRDEPDRRREDRDGGERRRRRSRSRSRDRRRRSRSRSRDRRRSRTRSPDYDPEAQRRRPTWFDIPPIGGAPPPLTQLPGAVQVFSVPTSLGNAGGAMSAASAAMSQQATRHARRIYVGGLPPSANENNIQTFFSNALAAVGGTTAGPGMCVVNVYINYEKKFAFVEMRTVEEASNAMALDGIMFEGVTVRIRRPADYNPAAAAALGPSMPNPNLNLAAIGLDKQAVPMSAPMMQGGGMGMQSMQPQAMSAADAAERIFIGGLPYYLTDDQCRELLGSFGGIKSFDLVKDKETGQSKGYGFCVYDNPAVTDVACQGLNGMRMGDRTLTVRRATEGQRQQAEQKQQEMYTGHTARVVRLSHAVTLEELADDDEWSDILEDMKEECGRYGTVVQVHIPRPAPEGAPPPPGLGKVIIEFADSAPAMAARNAMHGRKFGGRTVEAVMMGDSDYSQFKWD
ncbi:Splicing factor U2af large subunit B [Chlorella vulgaris]